MTNNQNENQTEEQTKGKSIGRSIRLSDDTFSKLQSLTGDSSWEVVMTNLLSVHERTTLESDQEFGSQINQVNSLMLRIGELFGSVIKQSNTKSEIQELQRNKMEEEYKEQLVDCNTKVKELKEKLQEESSNTKRITDDLRVIQEQYNDKIIQIIGLDKQIADFNERIEELKLVSKDKDDKIAGKNDQIDELQKELESTNELVDANQKLTVSVAELQEQIKKINEQHEKELEKKGIEQEKALLSKEKELLLSYQSDINKMQDAASDRYDKRLTDIQDSFNKQLVELQSSNKQLQEKNAELVAVTAPETKAKTKNPEK